MHQSIFLGITWTECRLVIFDPFAGTVIPTAVVLPANHGDFRGLTYDSVTKRLVALSQVGHWVYSIHPASGHVTDLGQLNISNADIGGLAFNPSANALYTTVTSFAAVPTSEVVRIDLATGTVVSVASLPDGYAGSLVWDALTNTFLGYTTPASGSSSSPVKSSIFRFDPASGLVSILSQVPYHTVLGLAPSKNPGRYISWVNGNTHFYAEVNPTTGALTQLANSDPVGVSSDAMMTIDAKEFHIQPAKKVSAHKA